MDSRKIARTYEKVNLEIIKIYLNLKSLDQKLILENTDRSGQAKNNTSPPGGSRSAPIPIPKKNMGIKKVIAAYTRCPLHCDKDTFKALLNKTTPKRKAIQTHGKDDFHNEGFFTEGSSTMFTHNKGKSLQTQIEKELSAKYGQEWRLEFMKRTQQVEELRKRGSIELGEQHGKQLSIDESDLEKLQAGKAYSSEELLELEKLKAKEMDHEVSEDQECFRITL